VVVHPHEAALKAEPVDWQKVHESLRVDNSVKPVDTFKPGRISGKNVRK
jgi:hypothetical protein